MRPALGTAASRLRIDSATAEVLRALDAAGVRSVLLKGASYRKWLGDIGEARGYADCDLLVGPGDGGPVARILGELGFVAELDTAQMPPWWREHGVAWTRGADLAVIDVHRTLPGIGVDDGRAWEVLAAETEQILVGGYPAQALSAPARAMHVALHAAHHGPSDRALTELTAALERADEKTWRAAAELARELEALDAFLAGLRLVPVGQALAPRLGTETAARPQVALLGDASRAPALTLERFVRASGLRIRLSMIRYKLVPPKTFMRRWFPLARRGGIGLMIGYAWRPVWVLSRVPAALRTWRTARRRPYS